MSNPSPREILLQKLIEVGEVDVTPLSVRTSKKGGVITALQQAIDTGKLQVEDLLQLILCLPLSLQIVMSHAIGLLGQSRKNSIGEVATLAGIKPSMVSEIVKDGFLYMIYCLQSVDSRYNPFVDLQQPVTNTPSSAEFGAQIHLLGMELKYEHESANNGVRMLVNALLNQGWTEIDVICSHTEEGIKEFIRGEKKLALLKQVLDFFGRELKPPA